MQHWTRLLETIGDVTLLDYAYMVEKRKQPDRLPRLIEAHRTALAKAREEHSGQPVFLIGKSMGGRVGCHVSLEENVHGVICLGYPLCGGGDPTKLRDAVLRAMTTPVLFVQGTRDSLCPLDLLEKVRSEMRAEESLHIVEGGDHSLLVLKGKLKAAGKTQEDFEREALAAIRGFVSNHRS